MDRKSFFFHAGRLFASALLLCLVLPAWTALPASGEAPVSGDALIIGIVGEPSNLLPGLSSDSASSEVQQYLYVAPLEYDKDLQVAPFAAESFDILDNGLVLRFVLRPGIFWEDGVELTARDVEFTYRLMIHPDTPTAYSGDYREITSFTILGRYSFEVRYARPFPRSVSTWTRPILPRHALEGTDLRATPLARKPISCGPYLLKEWESGSRLILTANPAYFRGRPFINQIIYRVIPDVTTMFLELKSGEIDLIKDGMTPQQFLYQTGAPAFTSRYAVYSEPAYAYTYLGYNLRNEFFSDIRVRRALAHAVNKQDLVKGSLFGLGIPAKGPYRPGDWAYNDSLTDYPHDPEKALALLAEAGWRRGEDGILRKKGRPFTFTLLTNQGNEPRIKTAILLQSQLRKIGVEVKIRVVEWSAFLKQFVLPGYFDAVVLGWTTGFDPDVYDIWHSSRIGGLNFIHYANAEVDSLLEQARSTFDLETRKKLYGRFQEILQQEQPYCFLYVPFALSAVNKRFRGLDPAPLGVFYNI
ncbi:MAG: peptide-binding protein, partial [Desulfovibrio sp.]|nr:peptide-binding protein [Desulfovibrio sp.]